MLKARLIDGRPDEATVQSVANTEARLEYYRAELAKARDKEWRLIYQRHIKRNESLLDTLKVIGNLT